MAAPSGAAFFLLEEERKLRLGFLLDRGLDGLTGKEALQFSCIVNGICAQLLKVVVVFEVFLEPSDVVFLEQLDGILCIRRADAQRNEEFPRQ
jgi:hypothetical protein